MGLIRNLYNPSYFLIKMPIFNSRSAREAATNMWSTLQKKQFNFLSKNKNILSLIKLQAYLSSEGWVGITKEHNRNYKYNIVFYPDNIKLVKDYTKEFNKLYGYNPHIKKLKNYYSVKIRNKIAFNDLMKYAPYNSLNWKVPTILFNNKCSINTGLSCFIDCDRYVPKKSIIQLQSVNQKGILHIHKLLKVLNIKSTITTYIRKNKKWNTNYILTINKSDIIKTKNLINLIHPKKRLRLRHIYAGVA